MPTLPLKLNNPLQNINYLIYCPETRDCLVIDPLDADLILNTTQKENVNITQIVNTHEHWDHTGGNEALKKMTGAKILAHHQAKNLIPGFDQGLKAGDLIKVGNSINLRVLDTPGHTMHSICLFDENDPAVYTGDTLFNCGCGNCHNGGDPELMFETFETQLQHLPDNAKLYPGHDYVQNNLAFAKSLQPELSAIQIIQHTLGEDKTVDPFFRLEDPELISALRQKINLTGKPSRKEVFLALRSLRNKW
jgi:hydroxyacylglutathione hydrolase